MTASQTLSSIEHEIGPRGSVSVRGFDGSIDLRAGDGPTVRLRGTGRRDLDDDYRIVTGPGELRVEAIGTEGIGLRWFRLDRTQDLELEVPRWATVRVETASGSIRGSGLQGDQGYRTVSGDVRLTGVGGRVVIDGVSGDVAVRADARLDLEARVVSADLEAVAPEFGVVRLRTTSGDLRLEGSLAEGIDHTIETVSGDTSIAATGPIVVEGRTVSGDLHTKLPHRSDGGPGRRTIRVGDGGPRVGFRSISGGLTVVAPDAVAAVVVPPMAPFPGFSPTSPTSPANPPGVRPTEPPDPGPTEPIPASPEVRVVTTAPVEADAGAPSEPATSVEADRLAILRELEAGRIDVDEAGRRLAAIDEGTLSDD